MFDLNSIEDIHIFGPHMQGWLGVPIWLQYKYSVFDCGTSSSRSPPPHILVPIYFSLLFWMQCLKCNLIFKTWNLCKSIWKICRYRKCPNSLCAWTGTSPSLIPMLFLVPSWLLYNVFKINRYWPIILALLAYDWLLSFDREVRFIWNWQSRATVSSLLYVLNRYAPIIDTFLVTTTIYPMSDTVRILFTYFPLCTLTIYWVYRGISQFLPPGKPGYGYIINDLLLNRCTVQTWSQVAIQILSTTAVSSRCEVRFVVLLTQFLASLLCSACIRTVK